MKLLAGLLLSLLALACGDTEPAAPKPPATKKIGAGNQAACQNYVGVFNGLFCVPQSSQIDPAIACPASLNDAHCSLKTYYQCVIGALRCTKGPVSVVDTANISTACGEPCR